MMRDQIEQAIIARLEAIPEFAGRVYRLSRDDEPSPSEATYGRCERECQERVAGGLECRDECERALAATRRAARA